jgi:hypothetical protein
MIQYRKGIFAHHFKPIQKTKFLDVFSTVICFKNVWSLLYHCVLSASWFQNSPRSDKFGIQDSVLDFERLDTIFVHSSKKRLSTHHIINPTIRARTSLRHFLSSQQRKAFCWLSTRLCLGDICSRALGRISSNQYNTVYNGYVIQNRGYGQEPVFDVLLVVMLVNSPERLTEEDE